MSKFMSKFSIKATVLIFSVLIFSSTYAQTSFPGKNWEKFSSPEEAGFSSSKLKIAGDMAMKYNTAAIMVIKAGKIVAEWGDVKKNYRTHSIRKSFLSELYGKHVKNGTIDLDKTMKELGITDNLGLSEVEEAATIRDVLKARSGVYHPALYESQGMKNLKPKRHSERAGTHWYYNNWDFNVAGTLYEKLTGQKIFESIKSEIGDPIGMEDFKVSDGEYFKGDESMHAAYPFRISARDLARFGLLMLNKGNWNGTQVINADWVEESTRYHSDATLYSSDGYGYMWWVSRNYNKYGHFPNVKIPEGSYSARGAGGHVLLIIPEMDMVIVHRVDTDKQGNRVPSSAFGLLVDGIFKAKIN